MSQWEGQSLDGRGVGVLSVAFIFFDGKSAAHRRVAPIDVAPAVKLAPDIIGVAPFERAQNIQSPNRAQELQGVGWQAQSAGLARAQMYNEEVNDLLSPESKKLQVHESKEQGVYVAGLREDIVTSATQVSVGGPQLTAAGRCP